MTRYSEEELLKMIAKYEREAAQREAEILNLRNELRIKESAKEYARQDEVNRQNLAKEKREKLDRTAKIHEENLKKESGVDLAGLDQTLLNSLLNNANLKSATPSTNLQKFKHFVGYTDSTTSVDGIERQIRFLKALYQRDGEKSLDFIKKYLDFLYKGKDSIVKNKNQILSITLHVKDRNSGIRSYTISSTKPEAFRMYVLSCVLDSLVIPEKVEGEYEYITHVGYENFKVLAYEIKQTLKEQSSGAFFPYWIKKLETPVEFSVGRKKFTVKPEDFNSLKLDDFQLYFERTVPRIKEEARWPCLWFALMKAGVSVEELTKIKKFLVYKTAEVERAKLGKIGELLNLKIHLHHLKSSTKLEVNIHTTGNTDSENSVNLGLFDGHYFIWKDIEVCEVKMNPIRFLLNCVKNKLLKPYAEKEKESMDVAFGEIFEESNVETISSTKIDIFQPNFNLVEKWVEIGDKTTNIYKEAYHVVKKDESLSKELITALAAEGIDLQSIAERILAELTGDRPPDICTSFKPRWFDKFRFVGCFDLETFVNSEGHHEFLTGAWCCVEASLICSEPLDGSHCLRPSLHNKIAVKSFRTIAEFFNEIPNNTLLYAHNLKFDYNFLFDVEGWKPLHQVKKDGQLYEISFGFWEKTVGENGEETETLTKKLTLRDSLKIITMPLRDFHKSFNLSRFIEVGKEYCNYEFYTVAEHRDWNFTCDSSQYSDQIPHQENFSPMRYLDYYCQQDVRVLMLGLLAFREDILSLPLDIPDIPLRALTLPVEHRRPTLEIFDYLSAASFAQEYFVALGAYEGVQPLCGSNLNFVMKAMIGGKCVCSTKASQRETRESVVALDAVSLYPSAMSQIPGYPIGHGKVWKGESLPHYVFGIFEVEILEMENKEYSLPAFRFRSDKKPMGRPRKAENLTDLEGVGITWDHGDARYKGRKIVADTITLKDYELLYGLKYKILQGIYWTEFNTRVNTIIKDLFQKRLEYKKAGNKGLSNVVKLIMNSAYGKNLLKPSEKEEKVYNGTRDPISVYGPRFLESHSVGSSKFVKILSVSYNQQNFAHIGVMILSQSKHYMNRLLHLSTPDSIFYQDTDSYHIARKEIQPLADRYREKYGAELLGSALCQFHVDYEYGKPLETLYSEHSVYVCPKVYAERIKCDEDESFDEIFFRCKGVPQHSIESKALCLNIPVMELYTSNKEVEFDLLEGRANIKIGKASIVETREEFKRKIKMSAVKNCQNEKKERENVRGFAELSSV